MYILDFLAWLNDTVFAIPSTILFLSAGIWFSIQTGFIQIRYFKRFIQILFKGLKTEDRATHKQSHAINGFHALFTAMATSIGTGSIVAPSLAIIAGGPGALFWLILYLFFGRVGTAHKYLPVNNSLPGDRYVPVRWHMVKPL